MSSDPEATPTAQERVEAMGDILSYVVDQIHDGALVLAPPGRAKVTQLLGQCCPDELPSVLNDEETLLLHQRAGTLRCMLQHCAPNLDLMSIAVPLNEALALVQMSNAKTLSPTGRKKKAKSVLFATHRRASEDGGPTPKSIEQYKEEMIRRYAEAEPQVRHGAVATDAAAAAKSKSMRHSWRQSLPAVNLGASPKGGRRHRRSSSGDALAGRRIHSNETLGGNTAASPTATAETSPRSRKKGSRKSRNFSALKTREAGRAQEGLDTRRELTEDLIGTFGTVGMPKCRGRLLVRDNTHWKPFYVKLEAGVLSWYLRKKDDLMALRACLGSDSGETSSKRLVRVNLVAQEAHLMLALEPETSMATLLLRACEKRGFNAEDFALRNAMDELLSPDQTLSEVGCTEVWLVDRPADESATQAPGADTFPSDRNLELVGSACLAQALVQDVALPDQQWCFVVVEVPPSRKALDAGPLATSVSVLTVPTGAAETVSAADEVVDADASSASGAVVGDGEPTDTPVPGAVPAITPPSATHSPILGSGSVVKRGRARRNVPHSDKPPQQFLFQCSSNEGYGLWMSKLHDTIRTFQMRGVYSPPNLSNITVGKDPPMSDTLWLRTGKAVMKWKAVKCVLEGAMFTITAADSGKRVDVVDLTFSSPKVPSIDTRKEKPYRFELNTLSQRWILAADTSKTMLTWVTRLQRAQASLIQAQVGYSSGGHSGSAADGTDGDLSRSDRLGGGAEQKVAICRVLGNHVCADCKSDDPMWCSLNLGVVICINCSGVHRQLGVHVSQVRSLTMDKLSSEQRDGLLAKGNASVNAHYLHSFEGSVPDADEARDDRQQHIKDKYEHRKWYSDEPAASVVWPPLDPTADPIEAPAQASKPDAAEVKSYPKTRRRSSAGPVVPHMRLSATKVSLVPQGKGTHHRDANDDDESDDEEEEDVSSNEDSDEVSADEGPTDAPEEADVGEVHVSPISASTDAELQEALSALGVSLQE